jgi:hypothetical protein
LYTSTRHRMRRRRRGVATHLRWVEIVGLATRQVRAVVKVVGGTLHDTPAVHAVQQAAAGVLDALVGYDRLASAVVVSKELTDKYAKDCAAIGHAAVGVRNCRDADEPIEMIGQSAALARASRDLAAKVRKDSAKEKDPLVVKRLVWLLLLWLCGCCCCGCCCCGCCCCCCWWCTISLECDIGPHVICSP